MENKLKHYTVYDFDRKPGPLDGVVWYSEKGRLMERDIPLIFYAVPKWGKIAVGCPLKKFKGTLITAKTLQKAVETWFNIYEHKPEAL